ncbi:MAG: nucleoside 2-deoxyribosyltransferase [Verrucomicrobiota bacterium]|nr:nucleoside 2-deoxyribosyltransferase [Verrucomicrobiota bacterium]
MKIYFAASIRGGRKDQEKYYDLINFISTKAEVLTEHVGSESLQDLGESKLTDIEIYQRDMEWLESADAVIAEVTTPSLGVGYELGVAEKLNKPIFCLFDQRNQEQCLSAMMAGNSKFKNFSYQSIDQAKQKIAEFLSHAL